MKKEISLAQFPKNRENPFLNEGVEEIQDKFKRKYVNSSGKDRKAVLNMVDGETGEILQTRFVRQMIVDEEKFRKIYISNFSAFFDLSKAAIRVFGYFMMTMKVADDMVLFDIEDCISYTGYKSKWTVYKAVAELCSAEIIARGWSDNLYFINPMIVFNGSRVTFVTEYINEKAEALRQSENRKMLEEQKRIEDSVNQVDEQ